MRDIIYKTVTSVSQKAVSEKPAGQYRNLQLMPGSTDLWQFEVQRKDKSWVILTNLGGENDSDRRAFAQKTADHWRKV